VYPKSEHEIAAVTAFKGHFKNFHDEPFSLEELVEMATGKRGEIGMCPTCSQRLPDSYGLISSLMSAVRKDFLLEGRALVSIRPRRDKRTTLYMLVTHEPVDTFWRQATAQFLARYWRRTEIADNELAALFTALKGSVPRSTIRKIKSGSLPLLRRKSDDEGGEAAPTAA
jgi:hypothetical protein